MRWPGGLIATVTIVTLQAVPMWWADRMSVSGVLKALDELAWREE